MTQALTGKKALITAASYGLGYAAARALVDAGCKVVLNSRSADNLEKAVRQLGGSASGIAADLARPEERSRLMIEALEKLEEIDILVVSTAHPPTRPFSKATDEDWELGCQLLLRAPIELSRAVLPAMKSNGYGRLIYIGSIFGLEAEASSVVQSTFRAGLNNFAKCIAVEEAGNGITANVICPGYFDTPLVRSLAAQYAQESARDVEAVLEEWKTFSPMNKFGNPDDIGAFITYLCSPQGSFFSGAAVHIDGAAIKRV